MPFGNPKFPSLGLSLLKEGLEKKGISTKIEYYNLTFAKTIGLDQYLALSSFSQFYLGEWVFSQVAFDVSNQQTRQAHDEALIKLIGNREGARKRVKGSTPSTTTLMNELIVVRDKAEEFVSSCVDDIERANPKILGFSTMFAQNCASLAVARRVKERMGKSAPIVIFGGSNCEGVMGYALLKAFPWIDYVCCGEGDHIFPDFAEALLNNSNIDVPGILGRTGASLEPFRTPPPVRDMDGLPIPNFDDYFGALRNLQIDKIMYPQLVIETSRGCWWGEISHCTFCGLNGLTMKYRSKTADRTLKEIECLTGKWGALPIQVVDNILNLDFFKTLFPRLIRRRVKLSLLFETKSNLSREQLQILKDAGVRHIQPGIESLSDDTLKLMKKGVTGLQNVWLLKRCRELGMAVSWNWLCGFPREKVSEYERVSEWVPLLHHLQPPLWFGSIHLDRFSSLFEFQEISGVKRVRPAFPYRLIYPLDERTLYDLAYYFDFDYEDDRKPDAYTSVLGNEIQKWMREWNISSRTWISSTIRRHRIEKAIRPILILLGAPVPAMLGAPVLAMLDMGIAVAVWDTRLCASSRRLMLRGLEAKVLRYTREIRTYESVIQHFVTLGYQRADVQKAIFNLIDRKIVLRDGERCLSLATGATVQMILARLCAVFVRISEKIGYRMQSSDQSRTVTSSKPLEENVIAT